MIKILCIGNSFSQDASALIEIFSDDIFIRNLYIGGCSLEKHVSLIDNGEREYEYQQNGQKILAEKVCLEQAIKFEDWDYITVQQVSGYSGKIESYYPYIERLTQYVKEFSNAEILFHQTWAYEKNSNHPDFIKYDNNQNKMWECIKKTTELVCNKEKLKIIPCGSLISRLKDYDYFDIEKGGVSLYRDGFHLTLNFGRIAAACFWIKFFTNKIPKFLYREDLPEGYKIILKELQNLNT